MTPAKRDSIKALIAKGKRHPKGKTRPKLKDTRSVNQKLSEILETGKRQNQQNVVVKGDRTIVDQHRSSIAGLSSYLSFKDTITDFVDDDGRISRTPLSKIGAEKFTLGSLIEKSSKVVNSGVNLITIPNEYKSHQTSNGTILTEHNVEFVTIEPANFTLVETDGGDAEISEIPIFTSQIKRDELSDYSIRIELTRKQQKSRKTDQLISEIIISIALGLGRCLDKEMCRVLNSLDLDNFNLQTANVNYSELRGLIGKNNKNPETSLRHESGKIIMQEVPSEICQDADTSLIAAWSRFALAIPSEVHLLVERTNAAGKLIITVWFGIQALIPNQTFVWKV